MLKQYIWRGSQWQFEESEAPADAVEFTQLAPAPVKTEIKTTETKATKPANKAFKGKNK